MEKKLPKIYLIYHNLLIAQDLWQAHYRILSLIFLKEFIELNVNTDMMINLCNCETCRIKYKCCNWFLEYTNYKDNRMQMFVL